MRILPALLLAALASPAWAETPERAMILIDAIRANDCAMTEAEANAALPALGLMQQETQGFIDLLFRAGLAEYSEERQALILPEAFCAASPEDALAQVTAAFDAPAISLEPWVPDFAPERGALLIGALRVNDCSMSETEAGEILSGLGLEMTETRDIAGVLAETGLAVISSDGNVLSLSDMVCSADPAGDAALAAEALASFRAAEPEMPAMPAVDPGEVLNQQFGLDGVRAMTELHAEAEGCSIALGDRAAAEAALADFVAEQINLTFNLDPDWPEAAIADLRRLVGAVLDDPGPAFAREGDRLTLTNCTP